MNDVAVLKQALPYMKAHKGRTFVVKLGGEIVADEKARASLAQDLALAHHVGIRLVVVHGGGPQASELSRKLGLTPEFFEGRRITDEDTLEVAKMIFAGKISTDLLGALRKEGLRAVGLSGLSGNVIRARRREVRDLVDRETGETRRVDFGHVGDIESVDVDLLTTLTDADYVPVLSSLGADDEGHVLNINADTVATEVALGLGADKLLVLTNVPGVLEDPEDPESVVSALSASDADRMIEAGVIARGMVPKVTNLVRAVRGGVGRTHILSGFVEHALLVELFTKDGAGTMITRAEEQERYLTE
jgi:acetylglutamate kinase